MHASWSLPRPATLAAALLLALAVPAAFAAEQPCKDTAGNAVAGSTNQGHEAGADNTTCASNATAVGYENNATAAGSTAMGYQNEAFAVDSTAVGRGNVVRTVGSLAMGFSNEVEANANYATAIGRSNTVSADRGVAIGSNNEVTAVHGGVALGRGNLVSGNDALAIGTLAQATTEGSVAVGSWSTADRGNAVSFGNATLQRQLINVAAGTVGTDAANLGQVQAVASALGGGAGYNSSGAFLSPNFSIQGSSYSSVADAFAAVDSRLTALGSGSGGNAVQYDGPMRDSVTLGGSASSGGTRIRNVAMGIDPTDAVNVEQMENNDQMVLAAARKWHEAGMDYADAGDAATLSAANQHADAGDASTLRSANQHADAGDAATLRSANAYTDARVNAIVQPQFDEFRNDVWSRMDMTDRRINRVGAMGTAMTQMAVNAANGSGDRGRLAVGVGYTDGEKALSVGYGLRLGRGSFSLGAAFSGSENTIGAGIGFDL